MKLIISVFQNNTNKESASTRMFSFVKTKHLPCLHFHPKGLIMSKLRLLIIAYKSNIHPVNT